VSQDPASGVADIRGNNEAVYNRKQMCNIEL